MVFVASDQCGDQVAIYFLRFLCSRLNPVLVYVQDEVNV